MAINISPPKRNSSPKWCLNLPMPKAIKASGMWLRACHALVGTQRFQRRVFSRRFPRPKAANPGLDFFNAVGVPIYRQCSESAEQPPSGNAGGHLLLWLLRPANGAQSEENLPCKADRKSRIPNPRLEARLKGTAVPLGNRSAESSWRGGHRQAQGLEQAKRVETAGGGKERRTEPQNPSRPSCRPSAQ